MSINIDQIRDRLKTLQSQTNKQDSFWKPTPGKHVIRIVPYKFNRANPFIELLFHYNIGGKSYLSPQSFGRPDPIVKFAEELKTTGRKDDWKQGKNLEPKLRTFVPIVVRGHENEGVKFWGFGKSVYQELLALIADAEYGDITDVASGHDITVEFKSAEQAGKNYPSTTIRPKPSKTKLVETNEQLKALFDTQKNILEIYKEPTYEELEAILKAWLKGEKTENAESGENVVETVQDFAQSVPAKSGQITTGIDNLADDLDKLFQQ